MNHSSLKCIFQLKLIMNVPQKINDYICRVSLTAPDKREREISQILDKHEKNWTMHS